MCPWEEVSSGSFYSANFNKNQGTHFKYKDTYRLKVNRWRKLYHANNNQKKAGVAILIADNADFRASKVIRDREGHYLMTKGSVFQENIVILNVYVLNNRTSKYMKQKLIELQGEIDESIIKVGDFNTSLSEMHRSSRQKIIKT